MTTQIGPNPPIPQRGDEDTFSDREDAFITWEANDLRPNANLIAQEVNLANAQAQAAANVATNANAAAGTSTTNYTPAVTGVGVNFVYVEAARNPQLNARIRVADQANPTTNFAEGVCTAFNAGTNTVTIVMDRIGSVPAASALWRVFQVGAPGADGANASVSSPTRATAVSGAVTVADAGFNIDVTAAGTTQTLDAAATLGDGWSAIINAVGFPVTIAGNFMTGRTSVVVPANFSVLVSSNGAQHRIRALPEVPSAFGAPGSATVVQSTDPAGALAVVALSPTRGITFAKSAAGTITMQLIDQTGAIVAGSTPATFNVAGATIQHLQACALDATRAVVVVSSTGAGAAAQVFVASFAGTVVSAGAGSLLEASGQFPAICVLQGTSKAVAGWGIASTGLRSSLVTIGAGTAITSVTAATTAAANTGATPIMTRAAAVSATQAVLGYLSNAGGGYPYFIAATENAGALNFSTQPFHISSVLGTGNIVGFDVTSGNSTQPRAVVSVVSTLGCRMATVDVSGTGTGAKLMWGDTIVVGDACTTGAYSSRLIKVSNDTYVRFAAGPDQTGGVSPTLVAVLTASIVTARDNGLEVEAGAMNIARQLAKLGLDGAVFGNNIVCAYADGDNSGFATARAIPLNSVV